jgi:hypothetical protein
MFSEIHDTLAALLNRYGKIDPLDVEVTFEPPTRERVQSLLRPAINFFLLEIQENTDLRQTNRQTVRESGQALHRMPSRRFDLRYMVSALATVVEDEQLLLWRTLTTLLKYDRFPDDVLSETLRSLEPLPTARVLRPDEGSRLLDYWSALGMPPRPALLYTVTVPVDLEITDISPLVLSRSIRYTRLPDTVSIVPPVSVPVETELSDAQRSRVSVEEETH